MVKLDYEKLLKTERLLFLLDKEECWIKNSERLLLCQMGFRGTDFAQIQRLALMFTTPNYTEREKEKIFEEQKDSLPVIPEKVIQPEHFLIRLAKRTVAVQKVNEELRAELKKREKEEKALDREEKRGGKR